MHSSSVEGESPTEIINFSDNNLQDVSMCD